MKNEIDAPQLAVNRTIFYAEYLRRERVGTFSVSTSDYDSRVSRVSIVSARSNLLAISNLTALALCEYPFVLGDGSGNAEIVLFAAPSVVESILNSLYIHLKRGETQDQILIEVDEVSASSSRFFRMMRTRDVANEIVRFYAARFASVFAPAPLSRANVLDQIFPTL